MLIAIGTAGACVVNPSYNGSVVCGTNAYIHHAHPTSNPNADSAWRFDKCEQVVPSSLSAAAFDVLFCQDKTTLSAITSCLKPAQFPAGTAAPAPLFSHDYVALSKINVTDYKEYDTVEVEAVRQFHEWQTNRALRRQLVGGKADQDVTVFLPPASIETTHGLLRAIGPDKFAFISGIVSRLGQFDADVKDQQNNTGSYNAGVVLAAVLSRINKLE